MEKLIGFLLILCMTLVSKSIRQLAFGRPDSIALEVSICSFIYNLLYSFMKSESISDFINTELLRCLTLLLFAFTIAIVHHYYKSMCMQQVEKIVERLSEKLDEQKEKDAIDNVQEWKLEKSLLDHTEVLARHSIDVWYSEFVDAIFYRFMKKTNKPEEETLKKKKSLVRWAFADIFNTMNISKENRKKLNDRDFNIGIKDQKFGMLIFDLMEFLSVIVALRII